NATVTLSGSSSPVVKLMTALPAMDAPPSAGPGRPHEAHARDGGAWCRRGFSLQIERIETVQQAMLHRKQRGGRASRCAALGVDALDVRLRCLGRDAES